MNEWITKNYEFLQKWCIAWGKHNWSDLLNHYVIYLHKNWGKFSQIPDGKERLKFTQTWLKNNSRWRNSEFNKEMRVNNLCEQYTIADECEDNLIDVYCESDRMDIKMWMLDTYKEFGEEKGNKIMKMRQIYLTLDTHEKVLYDLYFQNMNSMRDIGEKLNIPLSAVFSMLKELKEKIRIKYGINN